jgi:hypothetical protein
MKGKIVIPMIFLGLIIIVVVVFNVTSKLRDYRESHAPVNISDSGNEPTIDDSAMAIDTRETDQAVKDCTDCHTCIDPSHKDPCIPDCSRFVLQQKHEREHDSLNDMEETIVIGSLENIYLPVVFSHKSHAKMGQMGEGCSICHHYSPAEEIAPACENCHQPAVDEEHIDHPGLKGAYHRNCIFCHIEWSHENDCENCHLLQGSTETTAHLQTHFIRKEPSDIMVFPTSFSEKSDSEKSVVIFNHKSHIENFGFECADCHHDATCGHCHNPASSKTTEMPSELKYKTCSSCHIMSYCQKCHSGGKEYFNHAQTGWPLNKYHIRLSCKECHKGEGHMTPQEPACKNCHSEWTMENFNHSLVGFELVEAHTLLSCEDCHPDRQYDKEVDCAMCHG